jgi:hypothetical protein
VPPDGIPRPSPVGPPGTSNGNRHEDPFGLPLPPEPEARFGSAWTFAAILAFLVCIAMYAWFWIAGGTPVGAALVLIPILVAATTPIFLRAARSERSFDLAGLLAVALLLRFIAAYYRFDNAVDARTYNTWGTRLAESFRQLNFTPDTHADVPGTGSMRYISGLVHAVCNSDEMGAFLIFTWIAFLGCYFLYRAFVTAVPDAGRYRYAVLLFFWPSMVFWPSSIGKESVMLFSLGLAALGAARFFTRQPGGITLAFVGILITYLVRPHVALIMLAALGFAFIIGRGQSRPTHSLTPGSVAKAAAIVLLLLGVSFIAGRTARFLGVQSLQPSSTEEAFLETEKNTKQGGSEFSAANAANPIGYPQAAVTILFRPFLFEAHNDEQIATALETLGLALLVVVSWRRLLGVPWRLRAQPYVTLALAFVLVFFFVFAVISNFGILVRERTMMLPFALALLSVPALSMNTLPSKSGTGARRAPWVGSAPR